MAELIKRKKALSVSPLKASQTVGASLAFLGFNRAMPIMHGSQGCTAFAKVFFVRHFREPIPLQTTAMDQVSSVMGADENIVQALKTVCEKSSPSIIGLVTTGLAETQGADIKGAVRKFREENPGFKENHVVAVNTPDFTGCFESGFAIALRGIVETLVPDTSKEAEQKVGLRKKQVNVLCHGNLTPGDLEFITESIESFGLRPMLIPDLSGSLDGHLSDETYNPLTTGGLSIDDLETAGESIGTLSIGDSIQVAAKQLNKRTAVPNYHFSHLMTLESVDEWLSTLAALADSEVPARWCKQRKQLQDAMLDTHFMIGSTRFAMASDPDLLIGFDALMRSMGAELVAAVIPSKAKSIENLNIEAVQIGDMEDLEISAKKNNAQLIIGNSHAAESAKRMGVPLLRAGFPQYDLLGGFQRCWSGYRGIQQALFDLANLLMAHHQEMKPYHSIYSQKPEAQLAYLRAAQGESSDYELSHWGGH
ncbi:MAG: nitrogenase iron-molybdenum cofactor biosynthesis protein NifN [Pseudomonadales bacterium]|nr:nitrogenase iron-molybdenum cofactor biosynthesis protein NifN [Pseudomonadales bacterium]